jgi:hypothetical protein
LWAFSDVLRQELQSDKTPKFSVFGFVDNYRPATAEFLNDAVMRDGLPDHEEAMFRRNFKSTDCFRPSSSARSDLAGRSTPNFVGRGSQIGEEVSEGELDQRCKGEDPDRPNRTQKSQRGTRKDR